MTSWRERSSSGVQTDLDRLLDAALQFAERELRSRGAFYPYGLAVTTDGDVEVVVTEPGSGDMPESDAVLASCRGAVAENSGRYRAAAVAYDVSLAQGIGDDDWRDGVRVELEHGEGTSMTVVLPYRLENGELALGELRAAAGGRTGLRRQG